MYKSGITVTAKEFEPINTGGDCRDELKDVSITVTEWRQREKKAVSLQNVRLIITETEEIPIDFFQQEKVQIKKKVLDEISS